MTATAPIRTPRTTAAATELLERHAQAEAEVARIEADRASAIAAINAAADAVVAPLLATMATIADKLAPWWAANGGALTKGKRKSIELGGCAIGTVRSRAKLELTGDETATLADMETLRWAKPYVRTTVSIDKAAVTKGLDGRHAEGLTSLGFRIVPGTDSFFVRRVVAGAGDTVPR